MRRLFFICLSALAAACGPDDDGGASGGVPTEDVGSEVVSGDAGDVAMGMDAGAEDVARVDGPAPEGDAPAPNDGPRVQDGSDGVPGPADETCVPNDVFFETELWAPIFSVTCVGCHNPSGLAQGTSMVFDITDTPEAMMANMAVAEEMALAELQGVPVLLLKPSNLHPDKHAGGQVVPPGSTAYSALETWVKRVQTGDPCAEVDSAGAACEAIVPGPPMLRLLNRAEYDRTIEDLFGFPSSWGAGFTAENVKHGFDNQAEVLVVPPLLAEQQRDAAEGIAEQAMAQAENLVGCAMDEGDDACRDNFIEAFGTRVFRRPLSQAEKDRYALLHSVTLADSDFAVGIEVVLTAMLQSPHFLYRSELGVAQEDGSFALQPHEVASFLSYFLWGTMPDEELFARAADGTLVDPVVLAEQVDRLLEDDKSEVSIQRFGRQWLAVNRLGSVPKDPVTYPDFQDETREAMAYQTLARFRMVMEDEEGTLNHLLTGQEVVIDDALANFYGLPAPAGAKDEAGFGVVSTAETPYGGILTDGGVLTANAFANGSSPIHRGKFVREQLLCQELPLPPPGLVAEPPAMDPNATTRERFTAHAELEECAGCHRLMDPIGFALENYDGVGRHREDENGLEIDATGEIVGTGYTNGTFDGADELAGLLAGSPETHRCFAQQWLRFGYGMEVSGGMKCLLDDVAASFEDSGHRVRALLRALATSPHATQRVEQVVTELEPEVPAVTPPETGDDEPDAGSGDEDAGAPPPGPVTQTGVEVTAEVSVESSWGAGHCDQVTVTNETDAQVVWQVTLDVNGVLTQVWEATHQPADGGLTVFTGATWNHTLAPGAGTSFGYCADTVIAAGMEQPGGGGTSPDDLDVSIEIYTDWGAGYCANGAVTNVGDGTTTWGFLWPVEGEIYNVWEATATPMGSDVFFTGVASNATLGPGQTASFGFCANL